MGLAELSNVLWRQRRLLDLLLFRMTVERTLLDGDRARWLARATGEVEAVREELRETELVRAIVLQEVAVDLGLGTDPSLHDVTEAVAPPWDDIFEEHAREIQVLADEVRASGASGRELLPVGLRSAHVTRRRPGARCPPG